MAKTFLSASFTNTYFAPCSLTHFVVHSPALSFAPFTPHWLSEIQPVQLPSAAMVRAAAKRVAAVSVAKRTFMIVPPRITLRYEISRSAGSPKSLAQGSSPVQTILFKYVLGFISDDCEP